MSLYQYSTVQDSFAKSAPLHSHQLALLSLYQGERLSTFGICPEPALSHYRPAMLEMQTIHITLYVFYVCILKYIAITYTHICSACLTSYQKFGTNQAEAQWKMLQQLERAGWNREAVVKETGQCTRKTPLESDWIWTHFYFCVTLCNVSPSLSLVSCICQT